MKKKSILGGLILIIAVSIWSCIKDDPFEAKAVQQSDSREPATERSCTGNCSYRVKITSVSPSGSGWSFLVANGGSAIFESDNISMACDGFDGTLNNSLNTWYTFTIPKCDEFILSLADMQAAPSTCTDISGSLSYTIQEIGGSSPVSQESYTLNWAGTTVIRTYGSDSNCNLLLPD